MTGGVGAVHLCGAAGRQVELVRQQPGPPPPIPGQGRPGIPQSAATTGAVRCYPTVTELQAAMQSSPAPA